MTVVVFSDSESKNGRPKVEKAFVNPSLEFFMEDDKFIIKINKTYFYKDWISFSLKRITTTDNSRLYEVYYFTKDDCVISANEFIFTGED